jgi:hypothetical protein
MEREKKRGQRKKGDYLDLGSVASPFLSSHGGTRLDPFQGYAGSPTKPHEHRVHDGGGACGLMRARGPLIPRTRGRICGDLCSILRARIRCTIALVPLLIITALQLGATQSDPIGGPAHCDLRDCVRSTWGLTPISTCGTISSLSGVHRT